MAYYFNEVSHTFNEYLLVPGYSSSECVPANVSLKTPLVKFKKGEEPAISMNIPMTSAIMQSVSDDNMAIALAKECIQGTSTKLCVVMDFPFGSSHTSSKVAQCKTIIDEGDVFEIDMVANYGKIKSKDLDYVTNEIRLITELCHQNNVGLKVIVETDALRKEEVKDALECCVKAGADFIKTSTGYFRGEKVLGATPEICDFLVKEAVGRIKVKGSGGIRSKERLIELIELGIERAGVGCSSTMKILNDEVVKSDY